MAPVITALTAVLSAASDLSLPLSSTKWATQAQTTTGSSFSLSTIASPAGQSPARHVGTTTSPATAAASTHPSWSATPRSTAAASTPRLAQLELRQATTTSTACGTGYVTCSNPGGFVCVGDTRFGICNLNNCALVQDLALGVTCAVFEPSGVESMPAGAETTAVVTFVTATSSAAVASTTSARTASSPAPTTTSAAPTTLQTSTAAAPSHSSSSPAPRQSSSTSAPAHSSSPSSSSSSPLPKGQGPTSTYVPPPDAASTPSSAGYATNTGSAYTTYTGDGSSFPSMDQWVSSFDSLWTANLNNLIDQVCGGYGSNSVSESDELYDAIKSAGAASSLDPRFILAVVMQESRGCVRVMGTFGSHSNPGLLQDASGNSTCNVAGAKTNPCPASEIDGMIDDGVFGTQPPGHAQGDGLLQNYAQAAADKPASDAVQYYITARIYNSGSFAGGNLGCGVATHCYVSDIANRLTGWTGDATPCNNQQVSAGCPSS